jgi:hypothetical protein
VVALGGGGGGARGGVVADGRQRAEPFILNPADEDDDDGKDVARADRAYEGFHWGRAPKRRFRAELSPTPRALAKLGNIEAITYSTTKGSTGHAHYEHEFGEEGGRKPILAVDPRSNRLHIVGGDYRVEDRGIVD